MSGTVIVLYGPPASGKDTVTTALHRLDSKYIQFPRLKSGPGRRQGYRMTTPEQLDALATNGDLIWQNEVYGARYAIDRQGLTDAALDHVPVVHVGQPKAVDAIRHGWRGSTLAVALWCDRSIAAERLRARDPASITERLAVWDATAPLDSADRSINTGKTDPDQTAAIINAQVPDAG